MRTLHTLALALLLFAAPAPAQTVVPFRGGELSGHLVLPIAWEGKPAFLVVTGREGWPARFLRFDYVHPTRKPFWTPSFRLVAGFFQDLRPCAPGSFVYVDDENYGYARAGTIGANGTLTVTQPAKWPLQASTRLTPASYTSGYCDGNWCYGMCGLGKLDGPQLSALVLVME